MFSVILRTHNLKFQNNQFKVLENIGRMIDIYLCGDNFLVWDADDIHQLRVKYRIIGGLIGAYVLNKHHTHINSIPLLLSPYEVSLGIEKCWFRVLNESQEFPIPLEKDLIAFQDNRTQRAIEHTEKLLIEKKKRELEYRNLNNNSNDNNNNDDNSIKQQYQLQNQQQQQSNDHMNVDKNELDISTDISLKSDLSTDISKQNYTNTENIKINTPTTTTSTVSAKINQYAGNAEVTIYTSVKESVEKEPISKEWKEKRVVMEMTRDELVYPKTMLKIPDEKPNDLLKYQVYCDLWEKGYYISGGSKFGGTFLAYKGDPFLYHSTFIVLVKDHNDTFTSLDLITSTRLSVNVNKTFVLASLDPLSKKIQYISVTWKGVT
ncbi:hypothetical protein DLAC_11803 [Tieghemostelium lacteum]|uniref:tRNA-splicing endonuclease subunit SEN34 n=1 Tax=Tieghemostelium lacteum TaxID=361077 RepID=A0A151Z5Z0_TIELA|nr:hypothetical protein DLAC_11803 [Tieghemostelium lacteum]|eukprot:KYQ89373.1 hypothetical protein DLAC_11803 [Tieghemostelium lacteum]